MKKWFIADTHFSHANIIKYAGRPFVSVEEMDRALVENWNQCVGDDDQVFFLGDFGLGDVEHLQSICGQLRGNKVCMISVYSLQELDKTIEFAMRRCLTITLINKSYGMRDKFLIVWLLLKPRRNMRNIEFNETRNIYLILIGN